MERTLNIGVGMVAVLPTERPRSRLLAARGVPAWVAGEIVAGSGRARLIGEHTADRSTRPRRPAARWRRTADERIASDHTERAAQRREEDQSSSGSYSSSSSTSSSVTDGGLVELATQLALQGSQVGVVRAVLQRTGHLLLLSLGTAAPHGSTPSHRTKGRPARGGPTVWSSSWLPGYNPSATRTTSRHGQPGLPGATQRRSADRLRPFCARSGRPPAQAGAAGDQDPPQPADLGHPSLGQPVRRDRRRDALLGRHREDLPGGVEDRRSPGLGPLRGRSRRYSSATWITPPELTT